MPRADVREAMAAADDGERVQKSFYLTRELTERIRSVVEWGRAAALASQLREDASQVDVSDVPTSASGMVESALWAEVLRLERLLNDGKPFPVVEGKLRPGPSRQGADRLARQNRRKDQG